MFADMVGYSWRMEQNEELISAQTARAVELVRSLINDFGGEVVQVTGDGILALFDSVEMSVRLALHIQREFRDQAVWVEGEPIQFRIALNVGDLVITPGNVQGHSINVAARLYSVADPGTIVITKAVRDAIQELPGLSLRSLGRPLLKNISQIVEAFVIEPVREEASPVIEAPRALSTPESVGQPSVAVLPLINMSGDPANDHLCEGIADDIIVNLSRFRSLIVIARHSAFMFNARSMPLSEIARRLGVRYVLSGNLRRSGKRLRIGIELTDAATESVVWSDRFEISLEDLLELLDEVANSAATRLAVQIDLAERRQSIQGPRNLRAYGLVLRGHQLVLHWKRESTAHARRLFQEAAEIAPDYARAYSGISRTHNLDWRYSWSVDPDASLDTAVELARWAIQLDRLDARGYAEFGYAALYKKQHEESIGAYERALVLNPNDADVIVEYGDALVYDGRPTKAIELISNAMRLNPYYPDWYLWYLADAYNALGQPENVIATVRQMQDPSEGRRMLAANYAHLGRMKEAQAEAEEVMRLHPQFTISQWRKRPPYRDEAILERYVEGLRKAGLPD